MELKRLSLGIEDFAKLREKNCYYVDKTGMIKELLRNHGEVNLFTRPRRFGKSLNMSMLKYFFELDTNPTLFEGLSITKETDLCEKYMGQYPVIMISLKDVKGSTFEEAKAEMWKVIKKEAARFDSLQNSDLLLERDKRIMMNLSEGIGSLNDSILEMMRILFNVYRKKVIILIDEYDVPLQKAEECGYYKEMAGFISSLFSYSMKTNEYMEFAVVTGCLKIAKESIFTGFNNAQLHTIVDQDYDEWFGFTDIEVREMLDYYQLTQWYDLTKEWYDGYQFGRVKVYNPWDVLNWCYQLSIQKDDTPKNFWSNVSENTIIRQFAASSNNGNARREIEKLLRGESIFRKVNLQLTYNEIDDSLDNLWSVLFMTGYLTYRGRNSEGEYELLIPNKEIQTIMEEQILQWFNESIKIDVKGLEKFYNAFVSGDTENIEWYLNEKLTKSISIRDYATKNGKKENFYHGMLLGMLSPKEGYWEIESNAESGNGFSDIRVSCFDERYAFIIEIKYVEKEEQLDQGAIAAINQIKQKKYLDYYVNRKYKMIKSYGIAFYKKSCVVMENK